MPGESNPLPTLSVNRICIKLYPFNIIFIVQYPCTPLEIPSSAVDLSDLA